MMNGLVWLHKYKNNSLTGMFLSKFGGFFGINPDNGELFYQIGTWGNFRSFHTPEKETEFWNLVVQSVEQSKNLFIDQPEINYDFNPFADLPDG